MNKILIAMASIVLLITIGVILENELRHNLTSKVDVIDKSNLPTDPAAMEEFLNNNRSESESTRDILNTFCGLHTKVKPRHNPMALYDTLQVPIERLLMEKEKFDKLKSMLSENESVINELRRFSEKDLKFNYEISAEQRWGFEQSSLRTMAIYSGLVARAIVEKDFSKADELAEEHLRIIEFIGRGISFKSLSLYGTLFYWWLDTEYAAMINNSKVPSSTLSRYIERINENCILLEQRIKIAMRYETGRFALAALHEDTNLWWSFERKNTPKVVDFRAEKKRIIQTGADFLQKYSSLDNFSKYYKNLEEYQYEVKNKTANMALAKIHLETTSAMHDKCAHLLARLRSYASATAVLNFWEERKAPPESLKNLVPEYLNDQLIINPYTGHTLGLRFVNKQNKVIQIFQYTPNLRWFETIILIQ